jgi:hypothetical protein
LAAPYAFSRDLERRGRNRASGQHDGRTIDSPDARMTITIERAQACGRIGANARGKAGLLLVGNPIYIDCR